MKLTDAQCRNAKPRERAYNLTDGHGLFLQVRPNASRLWRCDYKFGAHRRTASFGLYPQIGLSRARDLQADLKQKIAKGIDPALGEEALAGPTFETVAREWFGTNRARWKTSYSARIWRRIEQDVLPTIGSKLIAEIRPQQVLQALRDIESRDANYTARRIHQMISLIFKWAIVQEHASVNPAADLHVALKPVPRGGHRAALKETELPAFFAALAQYRERQTRVALKVIAHTFVRTAELRLASWSEIDLDNAVWAIPGERMKMGKPHLVPLSSQAVERFRELKSLALGSELVLPGPRTSKPISENTLLFALYRMGYRSRATTHGFRATASTILNESEKWDRDAIEIQLAHAPDDQIRAAYNRGDRWARRVEMMQWYSDLLDRHEQTGLQNDLSALLR